MLLRQARSTSPRPLLSRRVRPRKRGRMQSLPAPRLSSRIDPLRGPSKRRLLRAPPSPMPSERNHVPRPRHPPRLQLPRELHHDVPSLRRRRPLERVRERGLHRVRRRGNGSRNLASRSVVYRSRIHDVLATIGYVWRGRIGLLRFLCVSADQSIETTRRPIRDRRTSRSRSRRTDRPSGRHDRRSVRHDRRSLRRDDRSGLGGRRSGRPDQPSTRARWFITACWTFFGSELNVFVTS